MSVREVNMGRVQICPNCGHIHRGEQLCPNDVDIFEVNPRPEEPVWGVNRPGRKKHLRRVVGSGCVVGPHPLGKDEKEPVEWDYIG